MATVPTHLQNVIEDFACRKVHNGVQSTHGLIICLDVDFEKRIEGDIERGIEEWTYGCLDRAHQALDFEYTWDFVFNVRDDQWQEDTEDGEEPSHQQNGMQVAVHFAGHEACNWPLFYENARPAVHPRAVLEHFHTPPVYVRTVGVSGVSETCLRDEWAEMISTEPNRFDRPGKGYMVHPMYSLPERFQHGSLGTGFHDA